MLLCDRSSGPGRTQATREAGAESIHPLRVRRRLSVPASKQRLSVETLRWKNGRLEMIDERALPSEVHYLSYDAAAVVAEGIRSMVVRGAPAIGCAAAYGVALEAL